MKTSLQKLSPAVLTSLTQANAALARAYPGEPEARQPVHTVYGGAHLFKSNTAKRMGEIAAAALRDNAPDAKGLADALGLPGPESLQGTVYERVKTKLASEAVEDFRIDFEDGYGSRPDAEEDGHAAQAATELAKGLSEGTLPPFIGIRMKPLTEELRSRSLRTLDLFVGTLAEQTKGALPPGFVVTLPKVTVPEQAQALNAALTLLESENGIQKGALKVELMVETTQSIFDASGRVALPALVAAAGGRCTGAHFGTYDYTASCGITAAHQHMSHPACEFAKHVMKVSLASTGVMLSDGATNVMPVGPHKAPKGGTLTEAQARENRAVVHRAWKLAYDHTRNSLVNGFYQGWDLHPAQLPVRYAAVYAFFLEGLEQAGTRLKAFLEKAFQATLSGDVFDDAATGQGLLNYFLRAINCGAVTAEETIRQTGLTLDELRLRSFGRILAGRRK
jgi:citrate lyase beta subunit